MMRHDGKDDRMKTGVYSAIKLYFPPSSWSAHSPITSFARRIWVIWSGLSLITKLFINVQTSSNYEMRSQFLTQTPLLHGPDQTSIVQMSWNFAGRHRRRARAFTVKAHFVVQSGSVVHWRQKNKEKKAQKRKKIDKEGKIEKRRANSEKIAEI